METIKQPKRNEEMEIDLLALLSAIRAELFVILLTALAGGILFFLVSSFLITPTYNSTTRIYVLNTQDDNSSITYSDLQSSAQLTKDYKEMFTTRPVLEEVISNLSLDTTWSHLKEQVSVTTATDGRIISITVTDENPRLAKQIADEIREAGAAQILDVMKVEAVNVVEEANFPESKASPSNTRNAAIGAMLGFCAAAAVVVIRAITDDRIKTAEDVERFLGLGVLGTIPEDDSLAGKKGKAGKKHKREERRKGRKR